MGKIFDESFDKDVEKALLSSPYILYYHFSRKFYFFRGGAPEKLGVWSWE